MNLPSRVQFHILTVLGSKEYMAWEYNVLNHTLIVDVHKLLVLDNDDSEEQMSSILTHVHLGVVDHLIIHAYVESCTQDAYDGRSMTLYHPL
jgi:hypothetical protein